MARILKIRTEKLLLGLRQLNCLLFLLFGSAQLLAQYDFKNPSSSFDSGDGLPNHYFKVIEKDDNGFVWIGTFDGLARFDGSEFKVYFNDPENPNSLSSSGINDISVDPITSNIWFATFKGLNRYNPRTGKFFPYYQDDENPNSIQTNYVSTVLADRQGEIWVGTNSSLLAKYIPERDEFEHFDPQLKGSDTFMGSKFTNTIIDINQDLKNDSILWIGQNNKLLSFNKYTEEFDIVIDSIGSYKSIYLHPNGNLYLAESGGKMRILNLENNNISAPILIDPEWNLREIFHKSDNELWISANRGLAVLDLTTKSISDIKYNDSKNKVYYDIDYIDEKGRIWAGTLVGLKIYDPMSSQFKNYKFEATQETFYYITEDVVENPNTGMIYMSVFSGDGLYKFDRATENWSVIPPPPNYSRSSFFGRGTIWSKKKNRLLILSSTDIYTLSEDEQSMVPFEPKVQLSKADRWLNFFEDHIGNLWLISQEVGLIRVDLDNGQVDTLNQYMPKCTEARFRVSFYQDQHLNVWLSGCNGHMTYSYQKDQFYTFTYHDSTSTDKTFFRVRGFQEDDNGQIWLSSDSTALGIADPEFPEKGISQKFPLKEWILTDSTKVTKTLEQRSTG